LDMFSDWFHLLLKFLDFVDNDKGQWCETKYNCTTVGRPCVLTVSNTTIWWPTSRGMKWDQGSTSSYRSKYDLKVCDDGTLLHILCFLTLSIVLSLSKMSFCLSFKTRHFRDWILSPSSGKTYSVGSNR
jgi:hypothetical protein